MSQSLRYIRSIRHHLEQCFRQGCRQEVRRSALHSSTGAVSVIRPDWKDYFLRMADLVAERSTCPRLHVGAVLVRETRVIATGYNGSVRGQPHCDDVGCLMVAGHCKRAVHAEWNALLQCAAAGVPAEGATLFCTAFPCIDCAKALVQAGILRVVYRHDYPDPHAKAILLDGGVIVEGASMPQASAPAMPMVHMHPSAFVAPGARVVGAVEVGQHASIWYGATLRGDIEPIRIGSFSNIQDGVVVHTDKGLPCLVGNRVTVGHAAILHSCVVEDGAMVGMGAIVLSGAHVGSGAIVAAGALVVEGQVIPPATVAMGVPARVVRDVREAEAQRIQAGVDHYVELARVHALPFGDGRSEGRDEDPGQLPPQAREMQGPG